MLTCSKLKIKAMATIKTEGPGALVGIGTVLIIDC